MKWYRLPEEGYAGGVCAGIAKVNGWDPFWVRILAVFLIGSSAGFGVLYFALWIALPPKQDR